jgi:hypothetical protein
VGKVNYKLKLPANMGIHPVFHISLLEPAPPGAPPAPVTEITPNSNDLEYEVEKILDCQIVRGKPKYLVKWKGYTDTENTWEPETHFKNLEMIRQFHRQNPGVPKKDQQDPPAGGRRRRTRK